jgi:hypothetical protein
MLHAGAYIHAPDRWGSTSSVLVQMRCGACIYELAREAGVEAHILNSPLYSNFV